MKKKLLLLTASYGTGHTTASKSLRILIDEEFHDKFDYDYLDFTELDCFTKLDDFFRKMYDRAMETPVIWDMFFKITNFSIFAEIQRYGIFESHRKIVKILADKLPDATVSTHFYWNFFTPELKKRLRVKNFCIITDSIAIHKAWLTGGNDIDYYIVPDNDTKEVMVRNGIKPDKVEEIGFPVNPRIYREYDRVSFLKSFGLVPEKLTLLVVFGLGAIGTFLNLIKRLQEFKGLDFQMIIITAKYENVYRELVKWRFQIPTKVIGWTDKIYEFLHSSDLLISKCGGAIVSEAYAAGLPLFIPVFTPGQERGNATIIRKYNLGVVVSNLNLAVEKLKSLIEKPELIMKLKKNVQSYRKINPAKSILSFIYRKLI